MLSAATRSHPACAAAARIGLVARHAPRPAQLARKSISELVACSSVLAERDEAFGSADAAARPSQLHVPVRDVHHDDAARGQARQISGNASRVSRCTGIASEENASSTMRSYCCGDAASVSRASPSTIGAVGRACRQETEQARIARDAHDLGIDLEERPVFAVVPVASEAAGAEPDRRDALEPPCAARAAAIASQIGPPK